LAALGLSQPAVESLLHTFGVRAVEWRILGRGDGRHLEALYVIAAAGPLTFAGTSRFARSRLAGAV